MRTTWGPAAAGAAFVGLTLRVLLLAERRGGLGSQAGSGADPEWGSFVLDSAYYDEMARSILGVDGSTGGLVQDAAFGMAPLYGYALAAAYAVFGVGDPTPIYLVQAGLGAVTAGLTAALAASFAPTRPGLAAWVGGLAVATYPVAIHYDITLLSVSLATTLTALATLALIRAWRTSGLVAALLSGLALGLAITARGNLLVAAPILVFAFALRALLTDVSYGRALLQAVALCVGLAGPIGLTAGHNVLAGGELVLVSANGGINLYRGNNPFVVSGPVQTLRLPAERNALAARSRLVASRDNGAWLSPAQADRFWLRRVLVHWREDPLRYAGLFLRRVHQTFAPAEHGDNTDLRTVRADSRVLSWLPWSFGPLSVLGVTGLVVSALGTNNPLRRRDLPARVLLAAGIASIALFFVLSRYRLALAPVLFAYSGVAVAWVYTSLRQRRYRALIACAVYVLGVGALLQLDPFTPWLPWSVMADRNLRQPEPCQVDEYVLRDPRIEQEYRRAKADLRGGDPAAAGQRLAALLQADPGHQPAAVDLAWIELQNNRPAAAVVLTEAVVAVDPCDEKAWANLGTARLRQGRALDAARAFKRANALDPYAPEYEAALGEALLTIGDEEQAVALLRSAVKWGPDLWQPAAVLGRRELAAGNAAEALPLLAQAAALQPDRIEIQAMHGLALAGTGDVAGARAVLSGLTKRGLARHMAVRTLEAGILAVEPDAQPTPTP